MAKSPDAFRTISEVADWLGIQAHVLRFWESKFTQVKPIKRAGGRRYYRPSDMQLLGGIKRLLHDDGFTIKGVQKILREDGMSHVAALSPPLDETTQAQVDQIEAEPAATIPDPAGEKGVVLSFETAPVPPQPDDVTVPDEPVEEEDAQAVTIDTAPQDEPATTLPDRPVADAPDDPLPNELQNAEAESAISGSDTVHGVNAPPATATPADAAPPESVEPTEETDVAPLAEADRDAPTPGPALQTADAPEQVEAASPEAPEPEPVPETPPQRKPRIVPFTGFASEADIDAAPATLSSVYRLTQLNRARAGEIEPLMARLATLRDRMASNRGSGPNNPDAKA